MLEDLNSDNEEIEGKGEEEEEGWKMMWQMMMIVMKILTNYDDDEDDVKNDEKPIHVVPLGTIHLQTLIELIVVPLICKLLLLLNS